MTPSVGRIVHYVSFPKAPLNGERGWPVQHWAALVTEVHDLEAGIVDLIAFPPASREFDPIAIDMVMRCEVDDLGETAEGKQPTPGTWHAPERVS
jgi:hypothetical protein